MHLRRPSNIPVLTVLQDRDFRAIWYVGALHEVSRRMELLILSWLIWETTNSPFLLGLVLMFNNVPRLFFSFFFGMVTDRFNRLRILGVAQGINAVVAVAILLLIVTDAIAAWQVFLAVCMQGLSKALEDPARRTSILDIVGEGRIVNALSLDQISNTTGKILGPVVAGFMLSWADFPGAYGLVLVVHVATLLLLTRVRIPAHQPRTGPAEPVWRSIMVGLKHASRNPVLLAMLYVTILMNAMAFPVQQFIPVIGSDYLHVGVALVGLLASAEGVGQLIGAGVMSVTRNLQQHGRVFIIGSCTVLCMGLLFAWSPWYALSFFFLTIGGVGQSGFATMQSSITMLSAPRELRGQMVGLMSFCIGLGWWLGPLQMGALASAYGTQFAISVNAVAALVLILPAVVVTPIVRRPASVTQPAIAQD